MRILVFYGALALFSLHTMYELYELAHLRQPDMITTTSPLRAVTQSALAFDRPRMFYDYFEITLRYPKRNERFPRMQLAARQSNYLERLVFQHWPYYFDDLGRTAALKALLCRPTPLLRTLHDGAAETPSAVLWTAWPNGANGTPPELNLEAACR